MFNAYAEPKVGCYRCHNGDATGTSWGPDLSTEVRSLSDEDVQQVVANGHGGMPAHKDKLTREHVATILAWLRSVSGATAP
jgi:mono/diheme cytochrome c family protein